MAAASGDIARSKDRGPANSARGSRAAARDAISAASPLEGIAVRTDSVADRIAMRGQGWPSRRPISATCIAASTRVSMSGATFTAASLINSGRPPAGGNIAKICSSRLPVRMPAVRRTIPPINTSVCNWPLASPATRPAANRAIASSIASLSPVAGIISTPERSQPMAVASFAIMSGSPTRIGRTRPALAASQAVWRVAAPMARTKANDFGVDDVARTNRSGGHAIAVVARKLLGFALPVSMLIVIFFLSRPP